MSPVIESLLQTQRNEPASHALVCHCRTAVQLLLALSLGVAFVCLFRYPHAVYLAAIPIPVLSVVLTLTQPFGARSRTTDRPVAKGAGNRHGLRETDIVALPRPIRELGSRRRWALPSSPSSPSTKGRLGRVVAFPLRLARAGGGNGFEGGVFPKL